MEEILPHYSHTVVVPVARLETAPHMLELAVSLADPEEGRVIALIVAIGEQESVSETLENLQLIVETFQDRCPVEIVTQMAPSVTRGILDAAREYDAETLILGVQQSDRRQVKLGSIVENVMEAANCDVLVYRLSELPTYDRVVVPIDSGQYNQIALNVGVMIAKSHAIRLSPLYIQRDYTYQAGREATLRKSLDMLPPDLVDRDIVPGRQPAERILRDVDENDLLILGFSQKIDPDLQIGENLSGILLNRSSGPVVLASRFSNRRRDSLMGTIERRVRRFNPSLTHSERNEMVWQARHAALLNIDYSMLILFSAGIASLGLLLNSVAVVVGAMLVAPLMSPLAALAIGLRIEQTRIIQRAGLTLIQGVVLAIVISGLLGLLVPIETATTEMLARGNPSLLDAAVAFVSGMVAAYATARKGIPAALAGVAIAAALMPPVCTIGLGFTTGNFALSGGAALLFTTNIVFIVMAEYIIFTWLGLRASTQDEVDQTGTRLWLGATGIALIFVVAMLILLGQQAFSSRQIVQALEDEFPEATTLELQTIPLEENRLQVIYAIQSDIALSPDEVEAAAQRLEALLGRPVELDVSVLAVVRSRTDSERQVRDYLMENWPIERIHSLEFEREPDDIWDVDVEIITNETITIEDVDAAEADLSELLGQELRLFVILQPFLHSEPDDVPENADASPFFSEVENDAESTQEP